MNQKNLSSILLSKLKHWGIGALFSTFGLFFIGIVLIGAIIAGVIGSSLNNSTSSGSAWDGSYVGISGINPEYVKLAFKYGTKYGLEPAYILAVMDHETNFDPKVVSTAGARGLMQVMPDTFADAQKWIAGDGEHTDSYSNIFDPEVNVRAATRYLKQIKDVILKGANIKTQAAAFNLGPYAVQSYLRNPTYSSNGVSLDDRVFTNNLLGLDTRADMGNKDYATCVEMKYEKYKELIAAGEIKKDGTVGNLGGNGNFVTTGTFTWPAPGTTVITSGVGPRWGTRHNGIDISSGDAYGKPIVASDGGTVTVVDQDAWGGGYGIHCYIQHTNGYVTRYGHMSKRVVKVGEKVSKGQVIGYIGSTGDSTGPHLHFEIRDSGGNILDPERFVSPS